MCISCMKIGSLIIVRSYEVIDFLLSLKTLETRLTEKGQEINGYIEKHNIQIRGQPGASSAGKDKDEKEEEESKSSGVLVASKS